MESLLLVITYETGPIEKKNAGMYKEKKDGTTTVGTEPIWETTITGGTEPLAPKKLLDRVKVAESLRYELEQRFLFQKKEPWCQVGPP